MAQQRSPAVVRHYRRERLELQCRLITPLFLGNDHQEAEWRAAPFKALMRYWWRVAQVGFGRFADLLAHEARIFGAAGEAGEAKSLLTIMVKGNGDPLKAPLGPRVARVTHPEANQEMNPLLYLAGMGLMEPNGQVKHSYFPARSTFHLYLDFPADIIEDLKPVLALIAAFGALGARCRNGWGSFQIEEGLPQEWGNLAASLSRCVQDWQAGFNKDYPNCLGLDGQRPLLWKTRNPSGSWEEAMRQLAEAYIAIRAGDNQRNIPNLQPGPAFAERHLLGVPLTHHPVNIDRHASPLRFVVRGQNNRFYGFVLHLPFSFSNAPPPFNDRNNQIQVWQRVHRGLDQLLTRAASYGDCL